MSFILSKKKLINLKKEISIFNKRIEELDSVVGSSTNKEDQKPPHY